MRIKHTPNEAYKVYTCFPCEGNFWYPFNHYSTKQGAMGAIKRAKERQFGENGRIWKIVWAPYPFASDKECKTVYSED